MGRRGGGGWGVGGGNILNNGHMQSHELLRSRGEGRRGGGEGGGWGGEHIK